MPGDGIVASATAGLDVCFFVEEHSDGVGGIAERIGCWFEFPAVLHHLTELAAVSLDLTVAEKTEDVVEAEINLVYFARVHYFGQQLGKFQLHTITIGTDDPLQGIGVNHRRVEPHSAFFGG